MKVFVYLVFGLLVCHTQVLAGKLSPAAQEKLDETATNKKYSYPYMVTPLECFTHAKYFEVAHGQETGVKFVLLPLTKDEWVGFGEYTDFGKHLLEIAVKGKDISFVIGPNHVQGRKEYLGKFSGVQVGETIKGSVAGTRGLIKMEFEKSNKCRLQAEQVKELLEKK